MKMVNYFLKQLRGMMRKGMKDHSYKIMALWLNNYKENPITTPLLNPDKFLYDYAHLFSSESGIIRAWYVQFKRRLHRHFRGFIFSASILAAYDWDRERIDFDSVKSQLNEFEFVEKLKAKTICQLCTKRILIGNVRVDGIDYCVCDRKQLEVLRLSEKQNGNHNDFEGWEPYIERKKMITWRREEKPGLYAYKVYVEYSDVSAEDFLFVQTDIEYRKIWDETAISLDIIDSEEKTNSEVVYWEMLWPKLFSNRDYVYKRRHFIDKEHNLIIIVNQSTDHPTCPVFSSKQRVSEYWSYMVIRPKTTFSKPGLEFVLTYFDNTGVSIPKSITTWVAQRQMPDFLDKIHQATLDYANAKNFTTKIDRSALRKDPGFEYPNLEDDIDDDEENGANDIETESINSNPSSSIITPQQQEVQKKSWWNIKNLFILFT